MKCITYNHQFLQVLALHVFSFSIYRDRLKGKFPIPAIARPRNEKNNGYLGDLIRITRKWWDM